MAKTFTTARVRMRPLVVDDYDFMRSLHTDVEVMKHIGTGAQRTQDQSRTGIEKAILLAQQDSRLGAWIVELLGTGVPVGNVILRPPATAGGASGLEVGYMFARAYWGQGLATEVTQGLIDYARREFGDIRIVALIEPNHSASRRVLQKLGFVTTHMDTYVDPTSGVHLPTEFLELIESAK